LLLLFSSDSADVDQMTVYARCNKDTAAIILTSVGYECIKQMNIGNVKCIAKRQHHHSVTDGLTTASRNDQLLHWFI
jgi:hypothetical protein